MRKFIFPFIALLVVLGGILTWRAMHPRLTDEQQIAAALDGICASASSRSPRGVANYLAKNFKVGGMSKSDFQNSLAGGIMQYRVIDLSLLRTKNIVAGNSARSDGRYMLSLKPEYNSPAEIQRGKFSLQWRQVDGEWLISGAEIESPLIR